MSALPSPASQPAVPAPAVPEGKLLAPGAVAKLFGVDPRTVTRWVEKGLLIPVLTSGGHRRYRYLDVMALRDSLQAKAAGEPPAQPVAYPPAAPTGYQPNSGF